MNIFRILFGLIFSIFPLIILARFYRGRFLFITNPYMKGGLMGFLLWLFIALLFYIDAVYGILGMLEGEQGHAFFSLFMSSVHGFITGGVIIGAFHKKLGWKR
ncbi:MAG: hypothetical protein AB1552_04595 [Nitrospirota bacterium]